MKLDAHESIKSAFTYDTIGGCERIDCMNNLARVYVCVCTALVKFDAKKW